MNSNADLTQFTDQELLQLLENGNDLPADLRTLLEEYRAVISPDSSLTADNADNADAVGVEKTIATDHSDLNTTNDVPFAVGDRCAIPFSYENYTVLLPSIILGYSDSLKSDIDNETQQYAQVLISIPITAEITPCPNHFKRGQGCNEGENCPYSHHGYSILSEFLLPFEILEQDNMLQQLQYGRKVWCQEKSGQTKTWRLGRIIDQTYGPRWRVRLLRDSNKSNKQRIITADIEHIMPFKTLDGSGENENLEEGEEEEWSESEYTVSSAMDDSSGSDVDEQYEDKHVKAGSMIEDFGSWQVHTSGFAAKMMEKMGYVKGQGLGKLGEGRVEPIQAKPYGKVRYLKGGDQSRPGLGSGNERNETTSKKTKRNKQNKNQQDKRREESTEESNDMFGFMNTLLKDDTTKLAKTKADVAGERNTICPKNVREANQMLAKISSKLDKAQNEYIHANEAYRRNRGTPFEGQFHNKYKNAMRTIQDLEKQKLKLEKHVQTTKAKKDMYTF